MDSLLGFLHEPSQVNLHCRPVLSLSEASFLKKAACLSSLKLFHGVDTDLLKLAKCLRAENR